MTQEERDLLKKVLCEMLPYDPFIKIGENPNIFKLSQRVRWICSYMKVENVFDDVKPYLRPMSNMTEEEKSWYKSLRNALTYQENGEYDLDDFNEFNDFLNRRKLDRYGLIEKGLALEAPIDMYNTKQ